MHSLHSWLAWQMCIHGLHFKGCRCAKQLMCWQQRSPDADKPCYTCAGAPATHDAPCTTCRTHVHHAHNMMLGEDAAHSTQILQVVMRPGASRQKLHASCTALIGQCTQKGVGSQVTHEHMTPGMQMDIKIGQPAVRIHVDCCTNADQVNVSLYSDVMALSPGPQIHHHRLTHVTVQVHTCCHWHVLRQYCSKLVLLSPPGEVSDATFHTMWFA
jgi:hypothetical protein